MNKLNEIFVRIINNALKIEEEALLNYSVHSLSISEIHTLEVIGLSKTKTMTDVARELRISLGALTSAINKLVNKGYVERSRIDEDRRIVRVKLSQIGEDAVTEHEYFHNRLFQSVFEPVCKQRQEDLLLLMEKYYEYLCIQAVAPLRVEQDIMLKPIFIRGIKIQKPLFQGDMGGAFSSPELAAGIAENGGVGLISGANPGFMEVDFWSNRTEANLRAYSANIAEGRRRAGDEKDKVAAGVLCASADYDKMVRTALKSGVRMIVAGAGMPLSLPMMIQDADVALIPIVASGRAVAVLRRNWFKKYKRAPDAVIFEGYGKSGHLGYKQGQLSHAKDNFYRTIVEIKGELADLTECPLIVANGPMDKDEIKKVLTYGADGIQFEEEFVSVKENRIAKNLRNMYSDESRESVIVDSPLGMPARIIRNQFADCIINAATSIKRCNACLNTCEKYDGDFCLTEAMAATAVDDLINGVLFCSARPAIIMASELDAVFGQFRKWELW